MAGQAVYTKMVLDATGHARKLVEFERDFTPGYQAGAYSCPLFGSTAAPSVRQGMRLEVV